MITIAKAHKEAVELLKKHSIASPFLDARILLSFICNYHQNEILLMAEELSLSTTQYELYQELILKRAVEKIPISKIINHKEFFGLDFYVDENVLDPRPDSEILVEMIISDYQNFENLNLLEIGTGSSCLIVAIIKSLTNAKATAIDVSEDALKLAKKNIERHKLSAKINLIQSDLFSNLTPHDKFNIILSNPPYICSDEINLLDDEVRKHDPILALDGGKDGLGFYRLIAKNAQNYLQNDGVLYLEIGLNQFNDVTNIFQNENWRFEKYQYDLAGIVRVLKFKPKN